MRVSTVFLRTSVLLTAFVVMSGCGGPEYRVVKRYIPPSSSVESECVQQAKAYRSACETASRNYQAECARIAESVSGASYEQAMRDYELKVKEFEVCASERDAKIAAGQYEGSTRTLALMTCLPPIKPSQGRFVDYSGCRDDSCEAEYDILYEACNGKIVKESRCVKNCD